MLQKVRIGVLADLGENVMDNAVVEAAAYTYEKSEPTGAAAFIRALHEEDRKQAIHNSIWDLANGRLDRNTFLLVFHSLIFYLDPHWSTGFHGKPC